MGNALYEIIEFSIKGNKMSKFWGSRFEKGTDKLADEFSFSLEYDKRLAIYDVIGSIAHATMLGKCKIISRIDSSKIVSGLKKIALQLEKGAFKFDMQEEDIHSNIQSALKKMIGPAADKLHTARSRNDLIVLDMKLYCMDELTTIIDLISKLQKSILSFAEKNKDVIIPAYTHLQAAQVVLLSHHMLAYIEMLERDKQRTLDAIIRTSSMPLGSCALAGTTLPTDRDFVTEELEFLTTTKNSIDSVSDRDFIIEALSSLAILGMHFSRISEDLIIWATSEFNYVNIDWGLCTGSSIMPHKKNPDILELIRGETAKLYSNLSEVLILTKGLPLTYNRDLQLDKPPLFESIDKIKQITALMAKLFSSLKVNKTHLAKRIEDESFYTVDLMEYLIKKGVSYREAHDIIGKMVKECLDKGKKISDLTKEQLKIYCQKFEIDAKKLLNAKSSVENKKSYGSTNPKLVEKQIDSWNEYFKQ
ncbi:MAG TPA: argininosuccinate lyase [Candidatus Omnitrophica bacterium]|nr:argininosuccinate lyase [Candidatus Omnitrophota bacterium]